MPNCLKPKFNTHEQDRTGLQYFNARYYDPEIGRFITPDPTIPNYKQTQAFNRYMFVAGNPISFADTDGFKKGKWSFGKIVKCVALVALTAALITVSFGVGGLAVPVCGSYLALGSTSIGISTSAGAAIGFVVGGTRGRILTDPKSAVKSFDIEKGIEGMFAGAALAYAGQIVPQYLARLDQSGKLGMALHNKVWEVNSKTPFAKQINGMSSGLKAIGLNQATALGYHNMLNNVYGFYKYPKDEDKAASISFGLTLTFSGPESGKVSFQLMGFSADIYNPNKNKDDRNKNDDEDEEKRS